MLVLTGIAACCALAGVAQQLLGTVLVERFAGMTGRAPQARVPVSVLKPLCGVDPLMEQALESFFLLDYPDYQLVFGVQSETDPVLALLERLRARYPAREVALVVDATQ